MHENPFRLRRRPDPSDGRHARLLLVAAILGFLAGLLCPARLWPSHPTPAGQIDPHVAWRSFSEVDLARVTLETIAQEYIVQAQARIARALLDRNAAGGRDTIASRQALQEAIEQLEEALAEFRGTGLEPELMRPLLLALKHTGNLHRWLDLYLEAAYRFPTHPLAADFRRDAVSFSQNLGREADLQRALSYLQQVPGPYLASTHRPPSLAQLHLPDRPLADHAPSL